MKLRTHKIFSGILAAVIISSLAITQAVFATPPMSDDYASTAKHEPKRGVNPETGKVSFIGAGEPISIGGVSLLNNIPVQDRAMGIAKIYGKEFGLKNPSQELKLLKAHKEKSGNDIVRYQQIYQGVPVLAGEMIVNMNSAGELLSVSGEVASDLKLDTKPAIKAQQAGRIALDEIAKLYEVKETELASSDPELWIFDESLFTASTRPVELVWRMELTAKDATQPIREMVLVNAQTGEISFHINQIDTEHTYQGTSRNVLENSQAVPVMAVSQVRYADLVIDEIRGKLYGADKTGNKVDVIDMGDMSVISSYTLASDSLPNGIDLSPDGNELAVAQSGNGRAAFINLTTGAVSVMASALSGASARATDVVYGRSGVLYALATNGLHVIDLTVTPHVEKTAQYVAGNSFEERLGTISSDKNTLYFATGTCCSGYNELYKFDVSAGLAKPLQTGFTYLYKSQYKTNIRLSLADDSTLLTAWGSIYDTATFTLKARNGQTLLPVTALPGRSFYAVAHDNAAEPDALYFFDEETSHQLSSVDLGMAGVLGAMAVTSNGNVLFLSSTAGMVKVAIGVTPPGTPVSLPVSLHQYRDFVFDMPRGVVYGTDTSGRIDVIDQSTGNVVDSYLLRNGASPIGIDLSPDGSELAVAMNGLEAILFLDPEMGDEIARVTPKVNSQDNLPSDVIYGHAGRLYSVADNYIQIFDTTTHTWVNRAYFPSPMDLAITADNRFIYSNSTTTSRDIYVFDVQTDTVTQLYRSPVLSETLAEKFDIAPDGSKVFTSGGKVFSRDVQEQIGTLEGGPGILIEYIPGREAVALVVGNSINFISADDYHLISTSALAYTGSVLEMNVSPDGSRLIANFSGGEIQVLDISNLLPIPPDVPAPSTIKYADLVVDEARGKLYGADKDGNKIDIINIQDLSVVGAYPLTAGAGPFGLDLSAGGNELAVAEYGRNRVAFINLIDGTITETSPLRNQSFGKLFDVFYGRPGLLYALSDSGIHVINTAVQPHVEDLSQYVAGDSLEKFGAITPDKNTLFYVTGSNTTGYNSVQKFDVSAGVSKPTYLSFAALFGSEFKRNLRLSMADGDTLLTSWGNIYNVLDMSVKAKNNQRMSPVIGLPEHNFYALVSDVISNPDIVFFLDKDTSYKRSSSNTGIIGTPGAMAATSQGNLLFISSTGGMTKIAIGETPPGTSISLPESSHQYRDFAFDVARGLIYGTDAANKIAVIDADTKDVLTSYLLPNGADPVGIDLSPDGNELAIALGGLEKILFLNPETGAEIAQTLTEPRMFMPYDVVYGRPGRLYAVDTPGIGSSNYLHAIDTSTHSWVARSSHPNYPSWGELALTADKKYLYASGGSTSYLFDVQTDALTVLSSGNVAFNGVGYKFTILPDGSKMITNYGEVWSSNLKEKIGSLEGGAGSLIEYVYGQGAVAVAGQDTDGNVIRFLSEVTHRLLTTYRPANSGTILEMEVAPDGSKLVVSFSSGELLILDISTILPVPPAPPPTPALADIQYDDLFVDVARGKLYGADKANSKIDVINLSDMYVVDSYLLAYGALPTGIDLSPDGKELAVAQSGLSRVAFINLENDAISDIPAALSGNIGISPSNPYDVLYGRPGTLYALSTKGLHTINTSATPHVEITTQYVNRTSNDKFGVLSADKNTLFFTAGSALYKFNVSAGLAIPTQLSMIYMDDRNSKNNIRLSLTEDNTLLTSWGNVYDTSFVVKAKNGQKYLPVIGLPTRSFYAIPSSASDAVYFFDEETSHKLSFVQTGKTGLPGALAVTGDGNTLFASSTGGMTKIILGNIPPGTEVSPPVSLHQYRDFAFDMSRNLVYGTDASGRVDVLDQDTAAVVKSFLLPNGANPIGIDLSPDGNELAVALNELQSILFLNAETGAVIARVKPLNNDDSNFPFDVIYGRAGRLYSNAQPDFEYIHVLDTTTHTWLAKSSRIISTGAEMAITADRKYLYANQKLSPNNIYVFDVQTDTVTKLYEGPHGYVTANRFTIIPDGSKVFTSSGQVWSGTMQTRLGTLFTDPGTLIEFIPNRNMVALARGNEIEFVDSTTYNPIGTHFPGYSGNILEMEVAPDGTKLIANYPGGVIYILDLLNYPPTPLPSSTPGPGPSPTLRPSSTPGPSPTPVPPSYTGNRRTYTVAGGSTLPGSLLCDQTQLICTNGVDTDADDAHRYAADTYVFYNTHHGRNSIDNHGSTITSTVHYGINYYNAFWNGFQVVYGDWMAADDVVGHELTHGVTQYTSNLIYTYQPGAINESFSDLWGEFIDQTNGAGDDSPAVKWLIGEDSFFRANRSMKNPPAYGQPDKMSSLLYSNGSYDNGGVHINSGVNNKAAYLMVEGETFNGRTVNGIGLNKTAAVYYEAQVYHLTMGANYNDLYYALIQACQNLIGGTDGINQSDCDQVQAAAEAVEMIPSTTPPTEVPTYPVFTPSTSTPTNTPYLTSTFTPSKTSTPLTPTPTPTRTATATQPASEAVIEAWIAGQQQGTHVLNIGQAVRVQYPGLNNGPVKVLNKNGGSILAAERVIYKVNGRNTSFTEMMGQPESQLDTTYWLPWYNNVDLDTQLRFANVSSSTATVHVYISGMEMQGSPFTLAPGESTRKSFAGINNGPVKIESNQNIVAAERVIYKVNGVNTSFYEMMALPNNQLDTTYWLPWYNNKDLDTQLRFANVSGTPATVHVSIGGQEMQGSPFTLQAGESIRKSFAGINNGPVKIESNVNIVAAERVIYKVNGTTTSFSEMMAQPESQLDTTYWLPWYNNVDLDTQLRFANTTNTPATVHVYIGAVEMQGSPFTLVPGESTRRSFTGINSGPVQIVGNVSIVAAERVIYKAAGGVNTSFTEMMGLPDNQLDTTYWFPWYNNVDLDTQLRFGIP